MDSDDELERALAKRGIVLEPDKTDGSILIGRSGCGPGIVVRKPQNRQERMDLYDILIGQLG